jgi:sodium-dependent dicarboxylate transporter 2/3/5
MTTLQPVIIFVRLFVKVTAYLTLTFFLSGALVMSSLMSPTATYLVFFPIAERVFMEAGYKKGDAVSAIFITALVITVNIGSSMSPLGHAIPLLAISFGRIFAGIEISFIAYTEFGVLNGMALFVCFLTILRLFFLRELPDFAKFDPKILKKELAPMTRREAAVITTFVLVILMWLVPWAFAALSPAFAARLTSAGGAALPPMLGCVAMSIVHMGGRPLLDIRRAMKETVPWPTLLLVAATLALGSALTKQEFGIIGAIVANGASRLGGMPARALLLTLISWAVFQSNFTVNSLSVTIVCAIAIPLAVSSGTLPPAALAAVIGAAASMAFATAPISAPSSVAASSRWWRNRVALKLGGAMALASIPIIVFIGYPLAELILG